MKMAQPRKNSLAVWLTALAFVAAGGNHFRHPAFYESIVPPKFPSPLALVYISGFFEIVGGVGLLIGPLRRAAAWGLILLLIAVFPANIFMAIDADRFADVFPRWALWARLPIQGVMIGWMAILGRKRGVVDREAPNQL